MKIASVTVRYAPLVAHTAERDVWRDDDAPKGGSEMNKNVALQNIIGSNCQHQLKRLCGVFDVQLQPCASCMRQLNACSVDGLKHAFTSERGLMNKWIAKRMVAAALRDCAKIIRTSCRQQDYALLHIIGYSDQMI